MQPPFPEDTILGIQELLTKLLKQKGKGKLERHCRAQSLVSSDEDEKKALLAYAAIFALMGQLKEEETELLSKKKTDHPQPYIKCKLSEFDITNPGQIFEITLASSVYIGLIMIRYVGYRFVERSLVYALVTYSTFAVFGLLAATAAFLIYAVYNDQPRLFVPWLVMVIVAIMYGTGTCCWSIIAQTRHNQDPHPWEISLLVVHALNTAINVYCLLCVFSQYQDLSHGKGTSQYYRRQRRTIHQTGIAGLVEEIVSGCDNPQGGVPNIGLSLEDLQEQTTATSSAFVAPPSYCEAPPAYSTLPREFEQQIERTTSFRSPRAADQEIFIMGSSTLEASSLAGVHSSQPPRYCQAAPPSYSEALRLSRFPPIYCPHGRNDSRSQERPRRPQPSSSCNSSAHPRQSLSRPRHSVMEPHPGAVPYPEPQSSRPEASRISGTRVEFICSDMGSLHI